MPQVINTNISALNAQRNLNKSQSSLQTSMQRLSSGLRINSAKDDAAGLAISDRFISQINGMNQASRNANDGISLAQTAEGALDETTNALQRMRTLAVQAANDTNSQSDREAIQLEINQLVDEINRIATTTEFNGKRLLDGSDNKFTFHIGANENQNLTVELGDMRANSLGQQPGAVQTLGHRVALVGDGGNAIGISGFASGVSGELLANSALLLDIQAGSQDVNITQVRFGGPINQTAGSALIDPNNLNYGQGAAKAIAERINSIREMNVIDSSGNVVLEGVYASAKTEVNISQLMLLSGAASGEFSFASALPSGDAHIGQGSIENGELKINGIDIGPIEIQTNDSDGSLVNAINAKSEMTGVKASVNSQGQLELTAEDGRDVILQAMDGTGRVADLLFGGGGLTQEINGDINLRITGQVSISAQTTISIDSANSVAAVSAGFSSGVTLNSGSVMKENVQAVGTIQNADVTTVEGANRLLGSVDSALEQVDSLRAVLGATQNRFEMTIRNLDNVAENLSAANSRIRDADFAAETMALTRSQILQQAGTAMLSQANAQAQNVMQLLQ